MLWQANCEMALSFIQLDWKLGSWKEREEADTPHSTPSRLAFFKFGIQSFHVLLFSGILLRREYQY
jgi:hypothetical protein